MKTKTAVISLIVLSAVSFTPAYANWFSNPRAGFNLNVGSAPNPTPGDVRAIGDSAYRPAYRPAPVGQDEFVAPDLLAWEGRTVLGSRGERLGYILTVDERSRVVALQTRGGPVVSMPAFLLVDRGSSIVAPTTSMQDIRDMARVQTGRAVTEDFRRRG